MALFALRTADVQRNGIVTSVSLTVCGKVEDICSCCFCFIMGPFRLGLELLAELNQGVLEISVTSQMN